MSAQIAPRPRSIEPRMRRAASTRPSPTHPVQPAPFRWSRNEALPHGHSLSQAPQRTDAPTPRNLPDAQQWAATLARAIIEVVTGARQAPQLRRWLLPELYGALTTVHLSPCARSTRPIHVRTCPIDAATTEAAVIVSTASRTYALALRLEEYRGRWMMTALELA